MTTTFFCVFQHANLNSPRPCRTEIHQANYGNRNYILVDIQVDVNGNPVGEPCYHDDGGTFTVYTKDASCGRGEYAEELDIQLSRDVHLRRRTALVKRIAAALLKLAEYEEGLRVSKVVARFGLFR